MYKSILKLAQTYFVVIGEVLPLRQTLKDRGIKYKQMQDIEHESFDKYKEQLGWNPADNAYSIREEIEDDDSHLGQGVFDNKELHGYIYGNAFDADDLPENAEDYDIKNYTDLEDDALLNKLRHEASSGKMFYVSNLALPRHKVKIMELFSKLFADVKKAGYKFLVFDALTDTSKLFMNTDGTPKQDRLDKGNLKLIATAAEPDSPYHIMTILQMQE